MRWEEEWPYGKKGHPPLLQWQKEETMDTETGKLIMREEGWI